MVTEGLNIDHFPMERIGVRLTTLIVNHRCFLDIGPLML